MAVIRIRPVEPFAAEVTVPGDRNISHLALVLAALSNGVCEIKGFLPSRSCQATVNALRALGVRIEDVNGDSTHLAVFGNKGRFIDPGRPIDCGDSGSTMALLAGVLAAQPFTAVLTGTESLCRRSMKSVAKPLCDMGARIEGQGERLAPPLKITGSNRLQAIQYQSPVTNDAVKSAVLLAGLLARGKTVYTEPTLSRDHTERMLRHLLVKVTRVDRQVCIWSGQTPESREIIVPGDLSSASFWVVATASFLGSRLLVEKVGLNRTRTGILDALIRMGAQIRERVDESGYEPAGSLEVKGCRLRGIEIGGSQIASVSDEIPILAVAGALAEGRMVIRDSIELRAGENDRISAVAENLRRMGVAVDEFADGMEIAGGSPLKGAVIESLGDPRIAMAFAIAGLRAQGETVIKDAECVETFYPGFGGELRQLQFNAR